MSESTARDDAPLAPVVTRNADAEPGGPVAVLLHGRGSNRRDLAGLAPGFPADWTIVTPEAPHAGLSWGYGPGSAWYRYVAEDRVVGDTLKHSLRELDRLMDALPELLGGAPERIVLGGFSQGGTTSLAWAFTRSGRRGRIGTSGRSGTDPDDGFPIDAVLDFSGFLVDDSAVELTPETVGSVPIFWGHGTRDPAIPFQLAERGRAKLRELGADLVTSDHEIGHTISPEEVQAAVRFLEQVASGRDGAS